jgi:hypothetical protein
MDDVSTSVIESGFGRALVFGAGINRIAALAAIANLSVETAAAGSVAVLTLRTEATVVGSTLEPARAWAAAHAALDSAAQRNLTTLGTNRTTGRRLATTNEVLPACPADLAVAAGRTFHDAAAAVRKSSALDEHANERELSRNLLAGRGLAEALRLLRVVAEAITVPTEVAAWAVGGAHTAKDAAGNLETAAGQKHETRNEEEESDHGRGASRCRRHATS